MLAFGNIIIGVAFVGLFNKWSHIHCIRLFGKVQPLFFTRLLYPAEKARPRLWARLSAAAVCFFLLSRERLRETRPKKQKSPKALLRKSAVVPGTEGREGILANYPKAQTRRTAEGGPTSGDNHRAAGVAR